MSVDLEASSSQYLAGAAGVAHAQNRSRLTMLCWARPESTPAVSAALVGYSINNAGTPTGTSRAALEHRSDDSLRVILRAGDAASPQNGSSIPNEFLPNSWHLGGVSVGIDDDSARLFHDNFTIGTPAVAFTPTATDNTTSASSAWGANENGGSDFFDGLMEFGAVYNRKLSEDENATMWFTHNAVRPYFGLLSLYPMMGALGTVAGTVKDAGPLQSNLTAQGSPVYGESFVQPRRRGY